MCELTALVLRARHPRRHAAGAPAARGAARRRVDRQRREPRPLAGQRRRGRRGTREYRHGDDLRRVHWRSTARYGELMVRREEQPWQARCTVLLDTRAIAHRGAGPASSFEWAVVGGRVGRRAPGARGATTCGCSPTPARTSPSAGHDVDGGGSDFEGALLDALAVVQTSPNTACATPRRALRRGGGDGLLVAVLGALDPEETRLLSRLRHGSTAAVAVLLDTADLDVGAAAGRGRRRHDVDGLVELLRASGWRVLRVQAGDCAARRCGATAGRHGVRRRRAPLAGVGAATMTAAARCGCRWPPPSRPITAVDLPRLARSSPAPGSCPATFAVLWSSAPAARLARRLSALAAARCRSAALLALLALPPAALRARRGLSRRDPRPAALDRAAANWPRAGRRDINRYAAPIGVSPGIELLTVGGVGLVALAVDTLAVTLRRAALAGLPLLVLYTVPTAVAPDGVGWVAFALGGVGFLTLLLAESPRAGQPVGPADALQRRARRTTAPRSRPRPLGQVGRRVGAAALGLALVVPAVLPDLDGERRSASAAAASAAAAAAATRCRSSTRSSTWARTCGRATNRPVIRYSGQADVPADGRPDDVHRRQLASPASSRCRATTTTSRTGCRSRPVSARRSTERTHAHLDPGLRPRPALAAAALPGDAGRATSTAAGSTTPTTFNVFGENSSTRQTLLQGPTALRVDPDGEAAARGRRPPPDVAAHATCELPRDLAGQVVAAGGAREVTGDRPTLRPGAGAPELAARPDEFHYSTRRRPTVGDAQRLAGDRRVPRSPARLLRALRLGDGRHGAPARHPGPGRGRLHRRAARSRTAATSSAPRRARLARALLRGRRLGARSSRPRPAHRRRRRRGPEADAHRRPGRPPTARAVAPTPVGSSTAGPRGQTRDRARTSSQTGDRGGGGIGAGPVAGPGGPVRARARRACCCSRCRRVTRMLRPPAPLGRRRDPGRHGARPPGPTCRTPCSTTATTGTRRDPPRRGAARLVEQPAPGGRAGAGRAAGSRRPPSGPATRRSCHRSATCASDVDTVRRGAAAGASAAGSRWRARLLPRSTRTVATALSEKFADALDAVDRGVAAGHPRLRLRRTLSAPTTDRRRCATPAALAVSQSPLDGHGDRRAGLASAAVLVAAAVPALFHPGHEAGRRPAGWRRPPPPVAAGGGPRWGRRRRAGRRR